MKRRLPISLHVQSTPRRADLTLFLRFCGRDELFHWFLIVNGE